MLPHESFSAPPSSGITGALFADITKGLWANVGERYPVPFLRQDEVYPNPWMDLLGRLNSYTRLPQGWNGHGARGVASEAPTAALAVLGQLGATPDYLPAIVPTARGWFQLEWHGAGGDLEVELLSDGTAEYYFLDRKSGAEVEGDLHADLSLVQGFLRRLR